MDINNKNNSMWGLLDKAYQNQKTNNNNISNDLSNNNSLFKTQEATKTESLFNLFDNKTSLYTSNAIQDSFEKSDTITKIQNFASTFNQALSELGEAMYKNGIINKEEKMGFDILQKYNPTLDPQQTKNILETSNLSAENLQLLKTIDKKIGAIRYFGRF
ncbi:hypothetical protein [Helicobacter mesocricetorum]|uniref:hypothetical protein n=1 Tax=Helicobacter mesocricetorum TaxID=87012 RepID=UPI000CF1350E|nr:hypothetical protein [Helicobacter mesocricetorum]